MALWAENHKYEVLKPNSREEMQDAFHGADIVIAIAYGRILSDDILHVPKYGFLNLHFSLLPAYRGAAPVQRSILHGDVVTGITIFKIDKNLDTGPIYIQLEYTIPTDATSDQVLRDLSVIGATSFEEVFAMVELGKIPKMQAEIGITFAPKITKDEARVDWYKPAKKIVDLIRAFTPNPGAWTVHRGSALKITMAVESIIEKKLMPGELLILGKKMFIGTASNSIEIFRIVPAGKKEMNIADWINGARLIEGETFE